MPSASYVGPKLPQSLLSQVNVGLSSHRSAQRGRKHPATRKEQRRLGRVEKKQKSRPLHNSRQWKPHHQGTDLSIGQMQGDDDSEIEVDEDEDESSTFKPETVSREINKHSSKRDKHSLLDPKGPDQQPVQTRRKRSKKLVEDDDEIAALEKKLGIKNKKKLPSAFEQDGLGVLLDGLDDSEDDAPGSNRDLLSDDAWRKRKRRKLEANSSKATVQQHDFESDSASFESESIDELEEVGRESEADDEEVQDGGFEGFEPEDTETKPIERIRENPYIAPGATNMPQAKYVPPSKRGLPSNDAELANRLRRQTQGLLNRLSESNMVSILNDIEKLYQTNPRQYVTTTLTELLLGLICDPTALLDTFLILHAGFIAAVYKVVGVDFGAQLIERIVETFDNHYSGFDTLEDSGKEAINLMTFLSHLYNFQVIGSGMIFDFVRTFLTKLSEVNTELLLRVVRASGSQLRQDDPSALKDLVAMLQRTVSVMDDAKMTVRTKFMIETINDLKNNKIRNGVQTSAVMSEHTLRMRKSLGSLGNRPSLRAREPLNVSLADIRDAEKKGKWWLVGASWKGKSSSEPEKHNIFEDEHNLDDIDVDSTNEDVESSLLRLAKENRMNTDIRRAIFVSIMSASDYKDAHTRLIKLNLSRNQESEIPRVLLRCSGMEERYNPYYSLISQKLCSEHKIRMAFQFALWDSFKQMGEGDEDSRSLDEEEDNAISIHSVVNHAKLFSHLISTGCHTLTILKNLDLVYLKPKTKTFVEVLLVTLILRVGRKRHDKRPNTSMISILEPVRQQPELASGLQIFLKKVVSKTDLVKNEEERNEVKTKCAEMRRHLTQMTLAQSSEVL